jgi:hypothetical protein
VRANSALSNGGVTESVWKTQEPAADEVAATMRRWTTLVNIPKPGPVPPSEAPSPRRPLTPAAHEQISEFFHWTFAVHVSEELLRGALRKRMERGKPPKWNREARKYFAELVSRAQRMRLSYEKLARQLEGEGYTYDEACVLGNSKPEMAEMMRSDPVKYAGYLDARGWTGVWDWFFREVNPKPERPDWPL